MTKVEVAADGACIKGIKFSTNKGRSVSAGNLAGATTAAAPAGTYLNALKGKQVGASLKRLKSASVVDVFTVNVTTKA